MRKIERELMEIRARLEQLEQQVRRLLGESPNVPPSAPDMPPAPQHLLAWLRAQGLISEPPPVARVHAQRWRPLPEEEKQAIQWELDRLPPGPMASDIVIENRLSRIVLY